MRSSRLLLSALTALLLALASTAAGCGDDDETASSRTGATATASSEPATGAGALSAEDARSLKDAEGQIAAYCRDRSAPPAVPVALIESLYEIDPRATGPDGRTIAQVADAAAGRLAGCGAKAEAARLRKLGR